MKGEGEMGDGVAGVGGGGGLKGCISRNVSFFRVGFLFFELGKFFPEI